ncbi:MAG: ABC transporter substrate-binding protein [Proteobacteria bacterium]|nr:ABC transporter substrate-binding protein [Pseudomonadota bacterium]
MRKILSFSFLFLVISCSKKSPENTLQVAIHQDISSLDPQIAEGQSAQEILTLMYEPLLDYKLDNGFYELIPLLLEKVPEVSNNGLTYTFKLKKNINFSSGRNLDSDDVIYTILRLADPFLNSPNFWLIERQIAGLDEWRETQKANGKSNYAQLPKGLKKINAEEFQIQLSVQSPQILHALAMSCLGIVPKDYATQDKIDWSKNGVGSGPYKVAAYSQKDAIDLELRADYWNKNYKGAKKISAKFFTSDAVKISSLEQKAIDIAPLGKGSIKQFINIEKKTLLESHKDLQLFEKALLDVVYVGFNLEDSVIKKAGSNFRKAISLSINKSEYNLLFNEGAGVLAQSPVPPGVAGYDVEFSNRYAQFDVEKAKEFLLKEGLKGDKLPKLTFESLDSPEALKFAEIFKDNLSKIGISMDISKNASLSDLIEKIKQKKAQLWLLSWQADYPDAENFLQLLYGPNKTPSPNFSNMDDKDFNKNFIKMRSLNDSPARRKSIEELMNLFVRNTPWVPIIHRTEFYLAQSRVKNFQAKQFGSSPFKSVEIQ